jgi:hypothetical protein
LGRNIKADVEKACIGPQLAQIELALAAVSPENAQSSICTFNERRCMETIRFIRCWSQWSKMHGDNVRANIESGVMLFFKIKNGDILARDSKPEWI